MYTIVVVAPESRNLYYKFLVVQIGICVTEYSMVEVLTDSGKKIERHCLNTLQLVMSVVYFIKINHDS